VPIAALPPRLPIMVSRVNDLQPAHGAWATALVIRPDDPDYLHLHSKNLPGHRATDGILPAVWRETKAAIDVCRHQSR
jgi:hypothetical protein